MKADVGNLIPKRTVRKVASITWRKVLDEAVAGAGGQRLRRLSSYTEMERAIRLRHYTKVMFVREPIYRAVSGWLDKFISPNGRDRQEYLIRYGCDMARRQNKNISMIRSCRFVDDVGNDKDHGDPSVDDDTYEDDGQPFSEEELAKLLPSFEDFARYLINGPPALRSDMHWESYHSRCQPCIVNYDYIGHYETLSMDADEIIRRLDLGNGATSRFPRKESASEGIAREILGDVDSLLLMRLYELYDLDCQLFGYSFQRMEQLVSGSDR
ncbi:carbohydrate sulfotransferase 14-like [Diadema setosum]|uniref:carbohydrate sulfotransferase 14-like n=1 Tax=Diadema setosum TaxID=31175 RepID=UPI003B3B434A